MFNLFHKIPSVSPREAAEKISESNSGFIDVRTREEYDTAHASGAINIPLGELQGHIDSFRKFDMVYVICATGGRSGRAAAHLLGEGINAVNVSGGTSAWREEGLLMV